MELNEFREDLLNRAVTRASVDGIFTADAFLAELADLLIGAEEVGNLDLLSFTGTGRRKRWRSTALTAMSRTCRWLSS